MGVPKLVPRHLSRGDVALPTGIGVPENGLSPSGPAVRHTLNLLMALSLLKTVQGLESASGRS